MKVVLQRDVKGLGKAQDVKEVAEGYARNYLIPRGLAVPATETLVRAVRNQQQQEQEKAARDKARAEKIAALLQDKPLRFRVKAGETGRLYGSITSKDLAEALARVIGGPFDKRQIVLSQPLRQLGTHMIELKLDEGVRAQAKVVVEAEA